VAVVDAWAIREQHEWRTALGTARVRARVGAAWRITEAGERLNERTEGLMPIDDIGHQDDVRPAAHRLAHLRYAPTPPELVGRRTASQAVGRRVPLGEGARARVAIRQRETHPTGGGGGESEASDTHATAELDAAQRRAIVGAIVEEPVGNRPVGGRRQAARRGDEAAPTGRDSDFLGIPERAQ
jgi:hypothetical protein